MPFEQVQENIQAFLVALKANSVTEDDFGNKKIRSKDQSFFFFLFFFFIFHFLFVPNLLSVSFSVK